ncbi:TPA: macrolide ABC transporter ATP-binding protein [Candidatus Uhrbacteria bacterium]|uniref:ABC transporter n=2 Tax=Candidatus Uhriibacteriota TaxID=1752732 RepID=A0A0G1T7K1_9BACT|nr:MAG: ABC transporter [Candidatus Uhrbacteria bacterium GW2011_GWF2_46_218]KKU41405.1 MAG: ABC transporter [Candidatus Uhrbacteria bacterium GW2011_GWE2_46_68]HBK33842.1 macrolide ABC transporter ATP-binding protein [Candidatus Uhrbacteria bacterium]HCB19318.1 macrolide ABC transporter ATP-binding protein [Candidatus Uhrbacteria bacterium]
MSVPLIQFQNVTKEFVNGEVVTPAIRGVTFSIDKGEFISIMGPSGSGKSTLMHIMGFLDVLSSGMYLFGGKDVSRLSEDELALMRRKEVGFIFQTFNLLAKSTVIDNVILPMVYVGVSKTERMRKAKAALEEVGLGHRLSHFSNQLSGGERQRVAIARAFINKPSVVFADEPTGNLDTKSGTLILQKLQEMNEQGHTIVMVTHEEEAAHYSRRILRVRDGEILSDIQNGQPRHGEYHK